MDNHNEFFELEAELKRLRPVAPPARLPARIAEDLHAPRRALWAWVTLPLAATLVLGVIFLREKPAPATVLQHPQPQAPAVAAAPISTYRPVSADNVLYALRDEGLVTLQDGTPARRYRGSYLDTITWKNPRTQASLRWTVPRTEERVIPVSFQ